MQLYCDLTVCCWWCAGARTLNLQAMDEPAAAPGRSAPGAAGQGHQLEVHPHCLTMKTQALLCGTTRTDGGLGQPVALARCECAT